MTSPATGQNCLVVVPELAVGHRPVAVHVVGVDTCLPVLDDEAADTGAFAARETEAVAVALRPVECRSVGCDDADILCQNRDSLAVLAGAHFDGIHVRVTHSDGDAVLNRGVRFRSVGGDSDGIGAVVGNRGRVVGTAQEVPAVGVETLVSLWSCRLPPVVPSRVATQSVAEHLVLAVLVAKDVVACRPVAAPATGQNGLVVAPELAVGHRPVGVAESGVDALLPVLDEKAADLDGTPIGQRERVTANSRPVECRTLWRDDIEFPSGNADALAVLAGPDLDGVAGTGVVDGALDGPVVAAPVLGDDDSLGDGCLRADSEQCRQDCQHDQRATSAGGDLLTPVAVLPQQSDACCRPVCAPRLAVRQPVC